MYYDLFKYVYTYNKYIHASIHAHLDMLETYRKCCAFVPVVVTDELWS